MIQLLVDLNDVYEGVKGNILMSRPLPNVSETYCMLFQEEHQREMSSEFHIMPQSAALNSNLNHNNSRESLGLMSKNMGYSKYGGKKVGYNGSHNESNNGSNSYAANRKMASRRQLYCGHCKMPGHSIQKIYKIHGYPLGHRLYKGKKRLQRS